MRRSFLPNFGRHPSSFFLYRVSLSSSRVTQIRSNTSKSQDESDTISWWFSPKMEKKFSHKLDDVRWCNFHLGYCAESSWGFWQHKTKAEAENDLIFRASNLQCQNKWIQRFSHEQVIKFFSNTKSLFFIVPNRFTLWSQICFDIVILNEKLITSVWFSQQQPRKFLN